MPTVLFINSAQNLYSTGKIVEQIGEAASRKGWNCYVAACARYRRPSKMNEIPMGTILSEKIHAVNSVLFDNHGLGSTAATNQLIDTIERINPDIVNIHNIHGYYINYKILFSYLSTKSFPIVLTMHDCWNFTGHCVHFDKINCYKWKQQCNNCPLTHTYPKSFIDRSKRNFKLKKQLFTSVPNMTLAPVSHWLGEVASNSFLRKYPVHVIQNGIDLDVFKPLSSSQREKFNIGDKFVVLGVASHFGKSKGLEEFVRLSKDMPEIKVVLVGASPSEIKTLPSEILAISRTQNQQEMVEFYSIADVFVNPTYEDTFPTTNLESLACGTPVITYETGGSPEAIDEETGIVVPKGDYEELISAICKIKIEGKQKYSKKCRFRAERLFNKVERFQEYVSLFEELVKK